jgi:MFS family permease
MDSIARSWLIYDITGSALQLGLVSAVRGLPIIIFSVIAGITADKYDKKVQLIVSQVVNAVLNILLATLIFTGRIQVWHIYATGFLCGIAQAFQQPARQVLINDIAGEKYLMNAISLNSVGVNLSRTVGPALCGFLIVAWGLSISYYIQAGLYIIAIIWTMQMHIPQNPSPDIDIQPGQSQSALAVAKEGFAYILRTKLFLSLLILSLAPTLMGMPFSSLLPVFAIDVWHGNADTQGLLLSMMGIGSVIGALSIASLGRRGGGILLITGAIGFGLSLVAFGLSPELGLGMTFIFLAGITSMSYTTQEQTIIQTLAPSAMRGRIIGVFSTSRGLMPLGSLIVGSLAAWLNAPLAVIIAGGACACIAIGIAIKFPELWRMKVATHDYRRARVLDE